MFNHFSAFKWDEQSSKSEVYNQSCCKKTAIAPVGTSTPIHHGYFCFNCAAIVLTVVQLFSNEHVTRLQGNPNLVLVKFLIRLLNIL